MDDGCAGLDAAKATGAVQASSTHRSAPIWEVWEA